MAEMSRTGIQEVALPGAAALRVRGGSDGGAAPSLLLLGGSTHRDGAGTWSATSEWLARRIAREHPDWSVAEVRHRAGSRPRLAAAVEDGHAAICALAAMGRPPGALVGFSLGGRVAVALAGAESVRSVVGLAAWLPDGVDLRPLVGRRLHLAHGTLDRTLPGVPGISPRISEAAAARAEALGVPTELTMIAGGVHGVAARGRFTGLLPLPRAGRWARMVMDAVAHDVAPAGPAPGLRTAPRGRHRPAPGALGG
jgi:dienelactone hydrolase